MSVRGAENHGSAGSAGAEVTERRAAGGQRVHFEALVAVGEGRGGGFEAESVDVSPDGMRLRTAYLPDVGDKLVCRFDGMGAEVIAEGEVIWRNQESRGGEFGLRFTGLDAATAEAIRGMCGQLGGDDPTSADAPAVPRGARVRLHIEGLGSPMKARVRESAAKEIEVGSNLEFLKVGRSLELEDVDQGKKREARIEQVKVDIDPATHIPQLVVSLRFDTAGDAVAAKPAKRSSVRPPAAPHAGSAEPRPAPLTRRNVDPVTREERAESAQDEASAAEAAQADAAAETDDDAKEGVGARAARASLAVAGKIGPALAGMGTRAKGAMGGLVAALQKKREARAEAAEKTTAPRRTTAPAPGGGLKSEGRRIVREDGDGASEDTPAPHAPKMNRRAAAIGGALGLTAVLVIFGVTRSLTSHGAANAGATAADSAAASASAAPVASAALVAGAASGTPVADVPLFGATPLSTTEPVPPPAAPSSSAVELAGAPPDGDGDDDTAEPAGKSGTGLKEWGQGKVTHPVVLKIKMDGPVERINGASGAMGFTISLPDRRAMSTASDLARKDKRLALVNVVNTSHGAEVTVQFKDGVPPYLARGKGDRLEIALGSDHTTKTVAKKKKAGTKPTTSTKKKSHQ